MLYNFFYLLNFTIYFLEIRIDIAMQSDNIFQYLDQNELITYQEMFSLFDK